MATTSTLSRCLLASLTLLLLLPIAVAVIVLGSRFVVVPVLKEALRSGGPELAHELEEKGYGWIAEHAEGAPA